MNDTINKLQADLKQAKEALTSINEAITAKQQELASEQAEAQRLDSLVLLKGDSQAMLDMLSVNATIKGLTEHIEQLNRAQTTASARRDEAEAELIDAQVAQGDVSGYLDAEELAKAQNKMLEQIDKITHKAFPTFEAHNDACTVLTNMAKRAKKLRGEDVRWDYEVGGRVSLSTISDNTIANSLSRYEAPRIAKLEAAKLKAIREAADVQRDAVASSALMTDRITNASSL